MGTAADAQQGADAESRWSRSAIANLTDIPRQDEAKRFVALRFAAGLSQADTAAELAVIRRRVRTLERRITRGLRRHLRRRVISGG